MRTMEDENDEEDFEVFVNGKRKTDQNTTEL